jgi:hypothetical protein
MSNFIGSDHSFSLEFAYSLERVIFVLILSAPKIKCVDNLSCLCNPIP